MQLAFEMLTRFSLPNTTIERRRNEIVYLQGDPADAAFYLRQGNVMLTVVDEEGKEAVIAILGPGDFFGEACLASQSFRQSRATTITKCVIARIAKNDLSTALKNHPALAETFLSYVLSRKIHLEADLADQLCHSCEKRLARTLLLLTRFAPDAESSLLPKINQETLAAMVGTTQPRISVLLDKFKKQGLIQHDDGMRINSSLVKLALRDGKKFSTTYPILNKTSNGH